MVKLEMKIKILPRELLRLVEKFLPFEIISIEELVDLPLPPVALAERLNKVKFNSVAKVRKMRPTGRLDLTKGMNAVIVGALADGEVHSTAELIEALVKNNYAEASINSLVMRLEKFGFIQRVRTGRWRRIEHALSDSKEAS
jgi:hypothetical protein